MVDPTSRNFMSAQDIMVEDRQKYWVVDKRDPNGNVCKYYTLCKTYQTHEHIGYKSKSVRRERRRDPPAWMSVEDVEERKKEEATTVAEEDFDKALLEKKDGKNIGDDEKTIAKALLEVLQQRSMP